MSRSPASRQMTIRLERLNAPALQAKSEAYASQRLHLRRDAQALCDLCIEVNGDQAAAVRRSRDISTQVSAWGQ